MPEKYQKFIEPYISKLSQNKGLMAISNAFGTLIPVMMVGSIFSLLVNIQWEAYENFITTTGLKDVMRLPAIMSTEIIALIAVFFIGYRFAEVHGENGAIPGLLSLVSFLMITPLGEGLSRGGDMTRMMSFEWLGAKGLFVAIIIGLVTSKMYMFFIDKGLVIKMPEGVPPTISLSFAGLIPGFLITTFFLAISTVLNSTVGSIHHVVFTFIQTPLEHLGGSYPALLLGILVMAGLWLLGIHGTMVTLSLINPVWMSLDFQNLAAYTAGQPLPNIIGTKFMVNYVLIGGAGTTIGLGLWMAFKAKSKKLSKLGKMTLPTNMFNINEPLLYGTPIVMNPILALPFVITPLVSGTLAYFATTLGIVPRLIGVQVPLPTPTILSGFLQGSWKIAALQIVIIFISLAIYFPFFKKLDNQYIKEEQEEIQLNIESVTSLGSKEKPKAS
ncbi:PTS sugar transporter subunit IIC [Alkalicella caledoniensis]|uniref:Permease IIC component n=1 Tax=Alkalicella caledoniensis TaxID=2731377 RepID=A0A7G9W5L2_ALKCA|nr:PTS transporter subunit EIIC [Alkalicella caledoniensis]QNO13974.1 PTS sugar transporter subunit IIC [Alkalicella caledoniensis]